MSAEMRFRPQPSPPALVRVLCIEDNQAILKMLQLALREMGGLDAVVCPCANEALQLIARQPPELILLDWDLPGPSGAETLASIQGLACARQTSIVIMTARRADQPDPPGVLGCLLKPLDPMHLAATLRRLHAGSAALPR